VAQAAAKLRGERASVLPALLRAPSSALWSGAGGEEAALTERLHAVTQLNAAVSKTFPRPFLEPSCR